MSHIFENRDRWGSRLGLGFVVGILFLIPMAVWSLFSLRIENELHDWAPRSNPEYRLGEWFRRHFPPDDAVLLTWDDSSLEDPRLERLVQKIRGTIDALGQPRGGSKFIDRVSTPQELLAQMRKNNVSRDESVDRLRGVLIGLGPLRIRLSEFGRARRDKVVESLRRTARDALGLEIEISDPDSAVGASQIAWDSKGSTAAKNSTTVDQSGVESAASEGSVGDPEAAATTEPSSGTEVPVCPAHDLVVVWHGMHSDTAKKAAFKNVAINLRLPSSRSRDPSAPVIEECFQVPGTPVALTIHLSEAGNADRPEAFRWLMNAAEQCGIPAGSIHMAGPAVVSSALDREVLKAVWDTTIPVHKIHRRSVLLLSAVAGGILLVWLLKSLRLAGLILGVSCCTTLVSAALVPLTGGHLNIILVILPTLLLVTALSLSIHLVNYWRRMAANSNETAVARIMKTACLPSLCAGLAAVIGQASLMTCPLVPLRDFGLYAAAGTLISVIVTFYAVPALLATWPGKVPQPDVFENPFWQRLANWIVRRQRLVTVVGLIAAGAGVWELKSFKIESSVCNLAEGTRTAKDYEAIEDRLAGTVPVDVVVRFDRESQQQLKFLQRRDLVGQIQVGIERLPEISGSLSLVDFLPDIADPGEQAHVRERAKYSAVSRNIEMQIKGSYAKPVPGVRNSAFGSQTWNSMSHALLAVADDVTEFNAEGDELWRVAARAAAISPGGYQKLRDQLDEICSSVLRTTSGEAIEKVPPVGALRSYHPGASHFIAGEIPGLVATRQAIRDSLASSVATALVMIGLVVLFILRHPAAACLAMIPNVVPIGAVFGLIAWCGAAMDIASAVTASISLGITVDGTLHLITWFRVGIRQGKSRTEAVGLALGHCGPAIWQKLLVASVSLAMLYSSELIVMGRFGWMMACLVAAASLGELVLTPALLAGPLGYFIERSELTPEPQSTTARQGPQHELPLPAHQPAPGKPHIGRRSVRIRRVD
jgi:predicted RND superfamily exporter protein